MKKDRELELVKQIIPAENHSLAEFDRNKIPLDYFGECLTEEEIKAVLGRKWKVIAVELYYLASKFVWAFKYQKEYLIPFNIWQTDSRLAVLGQHQHISSLIKKGCEIKLLSCVQEKYSFGKFRKGDIRYDKWYVMNIDCYKILDSIVCNDSMLNDKLLILSAPIRNSFENNELSISPEKVDLPAESVCFSSKLRLKTALNDEEIKSILFKNYPQITDTMKDIEYVNAKYLYLNPEAQRVFIPHIERNKKNEITKISIRDTSAISNLKTHFDTEEDRKSYNRLTREQYLKDFFGGKENEKYYEYDVKSSIYRITYYLNNGIWLDDSIDLYSKIYGDQFPDIVTRNRYKKFCMSIYFDTDSLPQMYAHLMIKNEYSNIKNIDKDEVIELLELSRYKMEGAIGRRWDNEVFLHESCIYAKLNKALWDKGFRTIQIYDGFYTQCTGLSKTEYTAMCSEELKRITSEYKRKYLI